ncbi:major facilitator superfamily MFS_1 [Desulforamulus reducens MI-1]|uniref:Major facilitator superfamily MFS_1 n=1 Tax=Desulforamulus reducens (strain ATCC BAA-1160 / DSM 100696 / MI-1) TaxID=349161 RepID=A4J280_DESRM|nr:MFS transporter [Desulforamulus reducens]ABO49183.1 major facilitator superfamily MFS_1 [Desulforamulus reducens MI-1]
MLNIMNLKPQDYAFVLLLFITELTRSAFFLTFWPLYSAEALHFSLFSAGLVVSAHYLIETLLKSFAGSLLDRRGRPVLLLGLLISFISLIGLYHVRSQWLALLLSGTFGLGFTPVWLAVISNVAPTGCSNRAARMGFVFSAWLLGMGIGPVGVNFVLARGYQNTFKIFIFLWALGLVIALLAPFAAKTTAINFTILDQVKRLASDRMVVQILLPGMFLQTLAASLLLPILPLYATHVLDLSTQQYGLLLTIGGATAILFLVPMGRMVDRFSVRNLLSLGFLLSALLLGLFPLIRNLKLIVFLVFLVGFSYAIILPAWNSLLAKAIPEEQQATGWGIFTTLEGLGIAAGPTLGGAIATSLHPAGAIYMSAFILAFMGIFYVLYPVEELLKNQEKENVS